jgi:hypothetical protein
MQNGIVITGGNGQGYRSFQFSLLHSICIDDCSNDRIVERKTNATHGQIVAGEHRKGN